MVFYAKINTYCDFVQNKHQQVMLDAISSSMPRWSPPSEGTVHINVDTALFSPSRQMGISVVIQNHIGDCSIAFSKLVQEITTPEVDEALLSSALFPLLNIMDFTNW
jgi:hypothetical protein